jgi:acetylglutamate kinase
LTDTDNIRAERAQALNQAELLIEALPWIKEATGKTVVIKYGGAAMTDERLRADVMSDIVLMKIIGLNPIIVHGGGNDITAYCNKLGYPVEFKDGLRVSPPEVMDIVKMTLIGKVNQELVSQMNAHGHIAVGLNGTDGCIVQAERYRDDMGLVGSVTNIDTTLLVDLIANDYIPIIASIAIGEDGQAYNVNADLVAGEISAAIGAHKVMFLTDVNGLYRDFDDKTSLISRLTVSQVRKLLDSPATSKGMLPKLKACVKAVDAGVARAHILNGTIPHSMLLEMFTNHGVGTMVYPDDAQDVPDDFEAYPLDNLASKLQ